MRMILPNAPDLKIAYFVIILPLPLDDAILIFIQKKLSKNLFLMQVHKVFHAISNFFR